MTVTTKLKINDFKRDDVLIMYGTEARNGTITWYDITQKSTINETNAEVVIEIGHFSLITALVKLQKLTLILPKDIVYRFNLLPFHYTMSVLVNKNSMHEELALLFVSQDVTTNSSIKSMSLLLWFNSKLKDLESYLYVPLIDKENSAFTAVKAFKSLYVLGKTTNWLTVNKEMLLSQ